MGGFLVVVWRISTVDFVNGRNAKAAEPQKREREREDDRTSARLSVGWGIERGLEAKITTGRTHSIGVGMIFLESKELKWSQLFFWGQYNPSSFLFYLGQDLFFLCV